jgi:hypothetical protein
MSRLSVAAIDVVRHLGVLVHLSADAVSSVLADERVPARLGVRLDRLADLRQTGARSADRDGAVEALAAGVDQALRLLRHLADRDGDRGISDKSVESRADVAPDDVTLDEPTSSGDSVDHLLVDGETRARGEAPVALELRRRATRADDPLDLGVDLRERHPGLDVGRCPSEYLGHDATRASHRTELKLGLDRDHRATPVARPIRS